MAIATLLWIRISQPMKRGGAREKGSAREKRIGNTEDVPQVPQSPSPPVLKEGKVNKLALFWGEVTFGIRYIWQRDELRTLLLVTALFWFAHDLGAAIAMFTVGAVGYRLPQLHQLEDEGY